jgi:hypothetical protein
MLARYSSAAFTNGSGVSVAAGAAVTVRVSSTSALASIFEDRDGLTGITQPGFVADSEGRFSFCVAALAEGFDITVDDGVNSHTLENVGIGLAQEFDIDEFWRSVLAAATAAAARLALGFAAIAAKGDSWWGSAADTIVKLTVGANGTVLIADSTTAPGVRWGSDVPLPRSYLSGLGLTNDTDADHDISIAVGECRDSTHAVNLILASAMVKQIDAAWAAGSAAGGLFSGTVANSTTYHVFLIRKDSDGSIDAGFDTSITAANIPSGYTNFRRIGSIKTDGSANIVGFKQMGDEFLWTSAQPATTTTTLSTTAQLLALEVPLGLKLIALYSAQWGDADGLTFGYISSPDQTDEAAASPAISVRNSAGAAAAEVWMGGRTRTDTSGQIRARSAGGTGNTTLTIFTFGWIDRRGRDD